MTSTSAPHAHPGRRIREARLRLGLNQAELARRIGPRVPPSYVHRLESEAIKRPSVDRLSRIAQALGVDLVDLTEPADPDAPDLAKTLKRLSPSARRRVDDLVTAVAAIPPHAREAALDVTLSALRLQAQIAPLAPAPAPDPEAAPPGWTFRSELHGLIPEVDLARFEERVQQAGLSYLEARAYAEGVLDAAGLRRRAACPQPRPAAEAATQTA